MEKEILDAIANSETQLRLSDIAGMVGILVIALITIYKQIVEPFRNKGENKPITAKDILEKEEAEEAVRVIKRINEMVEHGNSVILQKDSFGQNALLNIPRLLNSLEESVRKFVDSQLRQEGHITKMVNHQSDVLISFARLTLRGGSQEERSKLDAMVHKLESEKIVNAD